METYSKLEAWQVINEHLLTKRCTPYGVSKKSAANYVYEIIDPILRDTDLSNKKKKMVRKHISDAIWEAIGDIIKTPIIGKDYFQSVATEMVGNNVGIVWFTPTGFPVGQLLQKKSVNYQQVQVTVNGKTISRKFPKFTNEIDEKEMANAVSPNFVHSHDGAHLQLSIIASREEGMENFLVIHDSFSTDANNAYRFNRIIREQFVKMYKDFNWLDMFHSNCEEQIGKELITPRQTLGDFDLDEVLSSKYFFS
jgi:DNA-directed RNA polymerase, mitochondrial